MGEGLDPIVNHLNAPFWAAAAEGRLMLPHCLETGRAFWPPSPFSPFTPAMGAVEWREAAPAGTISAVIVFRRSFHPAFAPLMPFGIALVALDAGPRLQAHIEAADAAAAPVAGDRCLLRFAPILPGGLPVPRAVAHLS